MNSFVPIALFGWPIATVIFFAFLRPRTAATAGMLGAWLFLPMASYALPGIPDYSKMSAAVFGVLVGASIFDLRRLCAFRVRLLDIPVFIWLLCPFFSAIANNLGAYDGVSTTVTQTTVWGLPYFLGRVYFTSLSSINELCWALFLGGLIYIPLCLIEIRLSPQLHTWIYGYHQHSFAQSVRFGGWRPTVFMQHGLMVGMWMCMTASLGVSLWISSRNRRLLGIPVVYLVFALSLTAIACKSTGAIALGFLGTVCFTAVRYTSSKAFLICLACLSPAYIVARLSGWSGSNLLAVAQSFDQERADSLRTRIDNEDRLTAKALQKPILGWGGWGRNRVYDDDGRDLTVTDGLWIIFLGVNGFIGLISLSLIFILPTLRFVLITEKRAIVASEYAPVLMLVIVILLYWIDCLFNAMINPIYVMCTGALVNYAVSQVADEGLPSYVDLRVS